MSPEKLEFNLRLSGSFYISDALDTTKSVKITAEAEIFAAEKRDLQENNEFRITYKGKVVGLPEIEQGEKKLQAKVKSGKSKTWRYLVEKLGYDYDEVMDKLIANPEAFLERIFNL